MNNLDTLAQLSAPSVYEVEIDFNDMIGHRLPFGSLDRHQLRKVLCLPVELGSPDFGYRQRELCRSTPKGQSEMLLSNRRNIVDAWICVNCLGNYMASATLVDLRITNAKLSARCPRSLEAVLELPRDLVFEVNHVGFSSISLIFYISCRYLNPCIPLTFTIWCVLRSLYGVFSLTATLRLCGQRFSFNIRVFQNAPKTCLFPNGRPFCSGLRPVMFVFFSSFLICCNLNCSIYIRNAAIRTSSSTLHFANDYVKFAWWVISLQLTYPYWSQEIE